MKCLSFFFLTFFEQEFHLLYRIRQYYVKNYNRSRKKMSNIIKVPASHFFDYASELGDKTKRFFF